MKKKAGAGRVKQGYVAPEAGVMFKSLVGTEFYLRPNGNQLAVERQ